MAVHVPLHLTPFTDPDTDPFSRFHILKTYLEDDTADANSVAVTITAPINGPVSATCPILEDDTAGGVSFLWASVLAIAAQIPYDHAGQDKLVALVAAIEKLPAPAHLDLEAWLFRGYGTIWRGLPILGQTVYDFWKDRGLFFLDKFTADDKELKQAFPRDQWVNFNAFLARVSATKVKDLSSAGMQILEVVLEGDAGYGRDRTASMLNDNLPAAAVWLLYAGDMIYEKLTIPRDDGSGLGSSRDRRWALWKKALGDFMRDEALHHNTRDWAMGALQAMADINLPSPRDRTVTEPPTH